MLMWVARGVMVLATLVTAGVAVRWALMARKAPPLVQRLWRSHALLWTGVTLFNVGLMLTLWR